MGRSLFGLNFVWVHLDPSFTNILEGYYLLIIQQKERERKTYMQCEQVKGVNFNIQIMKINGLYTQKQHLKFSIFTLDQVDQSMLQFRY